MKCLVTSWQRLRCLRRQFRANCASGPGSGGSTLAFTVWRKLVGGAGRPGARHDEGQLSG
jgi:hypothetical protein